MPTPPIRVERLCPARREDFLRFFDHERGPAFADNPEWARCYCHYYHVAKVLPWKEFTAGDNRTAMTARIDAGEGVPDYLLRHPVYYAGPAKTPPGLPSGSFGPTTAGRMDSYVDLLQSHGASLVMIAKGNRSQQVTDACKKYGGFYLGSIGGPAAVLAEENIKKVECIDFPELGMEAVWQIEVENFPAFILVDDKGNDFFKQVGL